MTGKEIRCAVVGYGSMFNMGKYHAELISKTEGLRLTGVCDILKERCESAREDWDVPVFEHIDGLLAHDDADMISIVTPHDSHCPLALKALEAGKHVVSEKVMCMNVAEADKMIAAAKKHVRMLSVFQNRRWDRDYLTVRRLMEEGQLGEVFQIETAVGGWGICEGWRREAKHGGGNLYDWGAHLIDQAVQIAGCKPKIVYATTQQEVWKVDVTTNDTVQIEFENGLLVSLGLSTVDRASRRRWHVFGTEGTLIKENFDYEAPFQLHREVAGRQVSMDYPCIGGDEEWNNYYENIAGHLLRDEELIVKPAEVRWGIAVIEAAMRSGREHRAVEIAEIAEGPFGG